MRFQPIILLGAAFMTWAISCERNGANHPPGELARVRLQGYSFFPDGDRVYYSLYSDMRWIDVSDPRNPYASEAGADPDVTCSLFFGCEIEVSQGAAYFLDADGGDVIARVGLPDGPAQYLTLPDADSWGAGRMELLPDQNALVVARGSESGAAGELGTAGELVFVDIQGSPLVVSRLVTNNTAGFPVYVYTDGTLLGLASNAITVFDVTDVANPVAVRQIPMELPEGYASDQVIIYDAGANGRTIVSVAILGDYPNSFVVELLWHEIDEGRTSAALRGRIGGFNLFWPPAVWGNYAFIRARRAPEGENGTFVFALDSSAGIVEHFFVPSPEQTDGGSRVAVDPDRGLVYVGLNIQILDLGVLTTGEPRWP